LILSKYPAKIKQWMRCLIDLLTFCLTGIKNEVILQPCKNITASGMIKFLLKDHAKGG
jgi:hypothetical protein